jgi:hypothetical protein
MKRGGVAMIGLGEAEGENKAINAVVEALNSPLLEVDPWILAAEISISSSFANYTEGVGLIPASLAQRSAAPLFFRSPLEGTVLTRSIRRTRQQASLIL